MRRLASNLRKWLQFTDSRRAPRRRLEIENLEERSLLAANTTNLVGAAFLDLNGNGVREAQETGLPGIAIRLTGTPAQGKAVDVLATTDDGGSYSFLNILPGTYQVNAGNGGSYRGGDTTATVTVAEGAVPVQDFAYQGLNGDAISMRLFLSSTTPGDFPFDEAGSGETTVNDRSNTAPVVKTPLANVSVLKDAADSVIDLAGFFDDADLTNSQIRFDTSAGQINVELFDRQAPRTVANFYNYILANKFDSTIFHRLATGFVLQGGGFTFESNPSRLTAVDTDPAVQNEFGTSNTLGTIAMAKLGSDPNSATSQFFFNLANNASNLDRQNGGFTVFGKLVGAADQAVVTRLTQLTVQDQSDANSAFDTIPLSNYTGSNFPTDTTAANYALVRDVQVVKRNEALSYAVTANSNPNLVTATIENNRLTLNYTDNATGTSQITVRATDQFGATVDSTFTVTVSNQAPTTGVTLNTNAPTTNATLTATATPTDPDGDTVNLNYVWKVNGTIVQTTTTTAKTDTLNLATAGQGDKNQIITVEVTPNDGALTGAKATATATVANSAPVLNAVTLTPPGPNTNAVLTAAADPADADGDPITLTYTWKVNGTTVKTTPATAALTDTLDLSVPGNGDTGQQITVEVLPNDGTVNGVVSAPSTTVV